MGDSSQVCYKFALGHSNTIIDDFDYLSILVILDLDLELSLIAKNALIFIR